MDAAAKLCSASIPIYAPEREHGTAIYDHLSHLLRANLNHSVQVLGADSKRGKENRRSKRRASKGKGIMGKEACDESHTLWREWTDMVKARMGQGARREQYMIDNISTVYKTCSEQRAKTEGTGENGERTIKRGKNEAE